MTNGQINRLCERVANRVAGELKLEAQVRDVVAYIVRSEMLREIEGQRTVLITNEDNKRQDEPV